MNRKEHNDACEALKAWFQSQDINPADCIITIEMFIAYMIYSNSKSSDSIEDKIKLVTDGIIANLMLISLSTR